MAAAISLHGVVLLKCVKVHSCTPAMQQCKAERLPAVCMSAAAAFTCLRMLPRQHATC